MNKGGKLSIADKQRVIDNISSRRSAKSPYAPPASPACEICTANQWFVADHLITPPTFMPGSGLSLGGPSYPMVQLVCGNCGNTKLLNAVAIGLVDPTDPFNIEDDNKK